MACPNKNRQRPRTVSFRMTDDEFIRLEQRVKITGEVKGDYLREMVLNGEINISVGKFKSDKLAMELKLLRDKLDIVFKSRDEKGLIKIFHEYYYMIDEMYFLTKANERPN